MLRMLPALPTLRMLPELPMLKILPALPILRILKTLPMLPTLKMLNKLHRVRTLPKLPMLRRENSEPPKRVSLCPFLQPFPLLPRFFPIVISFLPSVRRSAVRSYCPYRRRTEPTAV
jgi:hypothetical protein